MKNKIIDYQFVVEYAKVTLILNIMELINEGWQPLGAPFSHDNKLHQAMVKYEK